MLKSLPSVPAGREDFQGPRRGRRGFCVRRATTKHTYNTLMRRLSEAGFKTPALRSVVLPDWWEKGCERDPGFLPEVELRVARFLGLPVSGVRDPLISLAPPTYAGAQLRQSRTFDRGRLAPAIHTAIQVASAVARCLRTPVSDATIPPAEGLTWRERIRRPGAPVRLEDLVEDLWGRGIPVVPMEVSPTPGFQGLACVVAGRPVIVLGHKYDEPGRVAFLVAHEAGHIAAGDCSPDSPVVDEEDGVPDRTDSEVAADRYATRLMAGADAIPEVQARDYRTLAVKAGEIERTREIDASAVVFAWARRHGDYATATRALKALYRTTGARHSLRTSWSRHVDLAAASETDRRLLACVLGVPERDEAAD